MGRAPSSRKTRNARSFACAKGLSSGGTFVPGEWRDAAGGGNRVGARGRREIAEARRLGRHEAAVVVLRVGRGARDRVLDRGGGERGDGRNYRLAVAPDPRPRLRGERVQRAQREQAARALAELEELDQQRHERAEVDGRARTQEPQQWQDPAPQDLGPRELLARPLRVHHQHADLCGKQPPVFGSGTTRPRNSVRVRLAPFS
jgi:hypothetical protein